MTAAERARRLHPTCPETEIRVAVYRLRRDPAHNTADHAGELADLLEAIAAIAVGLTRDPYEGTWQGRGLAVARAINGSTKEVHRG